MEKIISCLLSVTIARFQTAFRPNNFHNQCSGDFRSPPHTAIMAQAGSTVIMECPFFWYQFRAEIACLMNYSTLLSSPFSPQPSLGEILEYDSSEFH